MRRCAVAAPHVQRVACPVQLRTRTRPHMLARTTRTRHAQAYDSPLAVTLAAGSVALPQLLKLITVMEKGGTDLASCEQLPLEIELGQEFVYHSIFACPVSRDQSTAGVSRGCGRVFLCAVLAAACVAHVHRATSPDTLRPLTRPRTRVNPRPRQRRHPPRPTQTTRPSCCPATTCCASRAS
jgi:hypothetical protein